MANAIPKAATIVSELEEVETQIESDKERGGEVRAQGRALSSMSAKVEELKPRLEELGADTTRIDDVVALLSDWSEVMSPTADQKWNREDVNAKLQLLDALSTLNQLNATEVETVARLKVTLKASKGGTGERAPRKPAEKIDGRPEKVSVAGPDGTVFSVQSGNVANSAPNLKTAAAAFIKKATSTEVSTEDAKGLLNAAKEVVEGRATSQTYEGITFAVYTEA